MPQRLGMRELQRPSVHLQVAERVLDTLDQMPSLRKRRRAVAVARNRAGSRVPRGDDEVGAAVVHRAVGGVEVAGNQDVQGGVVKVFGLEAIEYVLVDEAEIAPALLQDFEHA